MEEKPNFKVLNFQKNSYIVLEGHQKADRFFIIQQGKVQITKDVKVEGDTEGDRILTTGDFFGVVSTMSSHRHLESARAVTNVLVITVFQSQYDTLILRSAQIAIKIMAQFSKQLRTMNETLAKLTLHHAADAGVEKLFFIAEYFFGKGQYNPAFHTYTQYLKYYPAGANVAEAKSKLEKTSALVKNINTCFDAAKMLRTYEKDVMIFAEGEPGDELFVILKGSVKITRIADNQEILLAVLKAGDIFGEMALLENKPRVASAIVYERCDVHVVNKANFEMMIHSHPQLITKVTTLLSERLWLVYKKFANTAIGNVYARAYDSLLIQLEKNRISLESAASYTFTFGPQELFSMMGVREAEGNLMFKTMLGEKKISLENDKIHTFSVFELVKQAVYYRKIDKMEKFKITIKNPIPV